MSNIDVKKLKYAKVRQKTNAGVNTQTPKDNATAVTVTAVALDACLHQGYSGTVFRRRMSYATTTTDTTDLSLSTSSFSSLICLHKLCREIQEI